MHLPWYRTVLKQLLQHAHKLYSAVGLGGVCATITALKKVSSVMITVVRNVLQICNV
jgi:hypothetical protein